MSKVEFNNVAITNDINEARVIWNNNWLLAETLFNNFMTYFNLDSKQIIDLNKIVVKSSTLQNQLPITIDGDTSSITGLNLDFWNLKAKSIYVNSAINDYALNIEQGNTKLGGQLEVSLETNLGGSFILSNRSTMVLNTMPSEYFTNNIFNLDCTNKTNIIIDFSQYNNAINGATSCNEIMLAAPKPAQIGQMVNLIVVNIPTNTKLNIKSDNITFYDNFSVIEITKNYSNIQLMADVNKWVVLNNNGVVFKTNE